ncbi:MAG: UpxY family transcription antiterminator [Bacteroidota bacterium]|nr:UpxY family transcription antiterminator [Bacteroidota bacterium]
MKTALPEKNWYVVYTRPRWEKKIAEKLLAAGIEHYCPLNKVSRQWSDRKKIVIEPVFKGYVFVRLEDKKKWDIRNIAGILNFVHWLGKPARIRDEEIDTIRKFLFEFDDVQVEKKDFGLHDKVRITQGVLMDYEGMVLSVYGNRVVVKIDSMDLQLSAHFDKKSLKAVHTLPGVASPLCKEFHGQPLSGNKVHPDKGKGT